MEKDSKLLGFVLGAIVPVLAYILIEQAFELLSNYGLIASSAGEGISRRMRSIGLFAICTILIPFNWAKRNYYDETMRGMIFPTLIYVGFWVYKYINVLF
jgi:hypothetical protein